ncbi:MAG TPA: DDE-type integrase/transposase/recombinase [Solirubrobacterales bacterium]|nr:DDE-type integrase/transposase/recombinase [Solirubrobacterales bacterium]
MTEDVVEICALRSRGWTISAIARHTGRDPKTIRRHLSGWRPERGSAPSPLEPYRAYLGARFADDPHVFATVLFGELAALGFERSYPTLVREIRRLGLRPACSCCRAGTQLTVELAHEPGAELQLDWLELRETPWGRPAYVLVGALSHSGRIRGVFSEGMSFAHLAAALDQLLRRFGGTAYSWRTDRMATFVNPGTDRLRAEAAELAKHYGVAVAICPAERPQRKGVVERGIDYLTRSWWSAAAVATPAQAQADLDRWAISSADARRRDQGTVASLSDAEPLLTLPAAAFPAILEAERTVDRQAMVAFEGNRYSTGPELVGQTVTVRARLGELAIEIRSASGAVVARHRRAPSGAGQTIRSSEHARALERAVLDQFSTGAAPRQRKANRPPGQAALAEARRLREGSAADAVVVDLAAYAEAAEVAR